MQNLSKFVLAYIECALWSSNDESDESGGEPLDANYDISDLAPECLAEMVKDCESFEAENAELLVQAGDTAQNGHDFWLTRNGHGAGFWDRGYGPVGDLLSSKCRTYGEVNLYVGDDGQIH